MRLSVLTLPYVVPVASSCPVVQRTRQTVGRDRGIESSMFAAVGLDDKLRPDRGKAKVKVKVNAAPGSHECTRHERTG